MGEAKDDKASRVYEAPADLAEPEPRLVTVVELRCFDGMIVTEIATMLDTTLRTVQRDWAEARFSRPWP